MMNEFSQVKKTSAQLNPSPITNNLTWLYSFRLKNTYIYPVKL